MSARIVKLKIGRRVDIKFGETGTYAAIWFLATPTILSEVFKKSWRGGEEIKIADVVAEAKRLGVSIFTKTGTTKNFESRFNRLASQTHRGVKDQPTCRAVFEHLKENDEHQAVIMMYPWESVFIKDRFYGDDSAMLAAEAAVCRDFLDPLGIGAHNDPANIKRPGGKQRFPSIYLNIV